jgi:dihydrofolate reductase
MRKIVVTEFLSLDGVMENPGWTFPYWNDTISHFKGEEMDAADALLLGRITYEGFAAAWPNSNDEGAPAMNSIAKYVVSNTLQTADWNNSHIIRGNVIDELRKLKQQPGKDLLVGGSAMLAQTLIKNNLVDTYRLLIYPVVLGKGKRLFQDGATAALKLVESKDMGGGVVALVYEPDRKA